MATQVQFRRGTTDETAAFTGALGEVTVDTTKKTCVVHDGSTAGGYPLLLQDGSNSALAPGSLGGLSLKFANSSNTGFYSPGTAALALVTNGISRLSIDSAGAVTIPGNLTVSGSLSATVAFGNGTAANPSIRFSNFPTTGLYAAGANQLGFSTNGVSRLIIDASGNFLLPGGASIITSADVGTVTSAMITNGTIVDADVNASAAIAGTKISPDFGSQNTVTTGTSTANSFIPSGATPPTNGIYLPSANNLGFSTSGTNRLTIGSTGQLRPTSLGSAAAPVYTFDSDLDTGIYSPGANQLAFATNGVVRLTIDASGNLLLPGGSSFVTTGDTGTVTSTMILNGTIVDADINVSAAIAGTKISPNFGSQNTVTTGTSTAASFIPSSAVAPTNGVFLAAANSLGFATSSTNRLTIDATGQIRAASLGSAAAPVYTFDSDLNTGIYSLGADQIGFATNGVARLTIDASGNVAISGGLTRGGNNVVTVGDVGTVTSTMILDGTIQSGDLASGTIVDANISASAEIAVSKLADGAARQLLQTDAAGTGVEWASNIDIPGTLDVTGNATFDSLALYPLGTVGAPSITFTGDPNTGIYSPGADQVSIAAGGVQKLNVQASGVSGCVTSSTEVASTSGTAIDFTGIPSWVKRITVLFNGVSTSGSSSVIIQVGTTSGFVTSTTYTSYSGYAGGANGAGGDAITNANGIRVDSNTSSVVVRTGHAILTNISGNNWVASHSIGARTSLGSSFYMFVGGGSQSLSGVLDRIRITTVNGTDTFDLGSINIFYEG